MRRHDHRTRLPRLVWLGVAALALAGCAGRPESLDRAQAAISQAQADPELQEHAPAEVERARMAMTEANRAAESGADTADLDSKAYVIQRYVEAARATAEERRNLEQAQLVSQQAQQRAEVLSELSARQTDRGTVVTLGDVLFDTASATLNPGGVQQIQRLATYLNANPARTVRIEGHADSRGADAYNEVLSQRRAESVRAALIGAGVDPARLTAVGMGEALPVASNSTAAGRQQNRRVEVIIQNLPSA
jgi:outer membrane protein OmpA-like peptidoglycan-associated protein